ncbi:M20/M25/M40 family metallo-hydrolase [Nonomuraea sp. NPDC052116]|uniref:M20/M25/M40 family metallo-hydrolase n=1 Tax=Nonomuraea sp. NPDC052116 TaxID=3155665 RepID=UPI0034319C3B
MTSSLPDGYAERLLSTMLAIPSPSREEAALARYLLGEMRELGFAAGLDAAGNVVGTIDRGPGPTVMLLGHLDTVPGALDVRCAGDVQYGRGAVDAKGPLAAMICAAAAATGFRGTVAVIGVVEEETPSSRGAMEIRAAHDRPDALVVGEPSGWSGVVLGYRGKADIEYSVEVPATHSSNPVPKAAELCAGAWSALVELLGPDATHASFDLPGATLISFTGDMISARARFDVRTPPGFDTAALMAGLRARLTGGELRLLNSVPACRSRRTDPVVRALYRAIEERGGRPCAKLKTATSDMNTLAEVWSVPMATYGPGDSRLDHADDEHISLTEFRSGIAVLCSALTALPALLGSS